MKSLLLTAALLTLTSNPGLAQTTRSPQQPQSAAVAAADVASPAGIVQAVYATISGPLGAPRDWARLRGLMAPGVTFVVTGARRDGVVRTRVLDLEAYISGSSKALATEEFHEHGVIGRVWRYAHIATVVSPYESRHGVGDAPFQRGINVFQLAFDGARWWIVSIAWEGETTAFPLPEDAEGLLRSR